jgi:RNA polymerase sigma-70 factor (ECF subfamily)
MSAISRPAPARASDAESIEALRAGDEAAFVDLIHAHHAVLLRVAMTYVSSRAVAEEVVQETWLGVLKGLDRFERRSSLKTWIFSIAANIARTRAVREGRCLPFSSLSGIDDERSEHSVDPDRFFSHDHPRHPGHWARGPASWEMPEERLLSGETRDVILAAIEQLPPAQRLVVTLRDIEGWSGEETCRALELTDGNQRVLLHRARSKLRAALELYLSPVGIAA